MKTYTIERVGPLGNHGYALRCLLLKRELGVFPTTGQAEAFAAGYTEAGGFTADALICDLKGLLEHYVSGRPDCTGGTTRTQAMATLREAAAYLNR